MITCNICFDDQPRDKTFEFPQCNHIFCTPCLKEMFEEKIKTKQVHVDNFKCPQCEQPFDPAIMQFFVSPEAYAKYSESAIDSNQIYGLADYEMMINCFNQECDAKFIIWKDAEYCTCPTCKIKYCCKCFLKDHPDITCEQAKLTQDDTEYKEMKRKFGIARCPKCNFMGEKISGCNFIRCMSKQCQGKNAYCYQCDIQLTDADHTAHFEKNNAFGGACRVKVNGKWVDKKDAPPPEKIKVEAPKPVLQVEEEVVKIICNRCKHQSAYFSLPNIIYICDSMKCGGFMYCYKCNERLDQNDVASHFGNFEYKCKKQKI